MTFLASPLLANPFLANPFLANPECCVCCLCCCVCCCCIGSSHFGSRQKASEKLERDHFSTVRPTLTEPEQSMLLSQGGPLSAEPFVCVPTSRETRFDSAVFRVLLLCRLQLPLQPSARVCWCAVSPTFLATGPHVPRQECWDVEVSQLKAQRSCREVGGRVRTSSGQGPRFGCVLDGRRIEVIVDGLPLFGGVQLAVDTTLVSVLRGDGMKRRGANQHAGVALREARALKERTYPELAREGGRARLVVAGEVGGRWSSETQDFLCSLAKAEARSAPAATTFEWYAA